MCSRNVKQIIKYMLKIPVVKGNINKALKLFKRKFRDTQVLKELKERKNYTKKSLKRRIEKDEAIRRLKRKNDDN